MPSVQARIQPCLWFDTQAEEAVRFYTGVFADSRIGAITHYPEAGREQHGKPPGSVMTVGSSCSASPCWRSTAGLTSSSALRCR